MYLLACYSDTINICVVINSYTKTTKNHGNKLVMFALLIISFYTFRCFNNKNLHFPMAIEFNFKLTVKIFAAF
jgi:hypothetical protein